MIVKWFGQRPKIQDADLINEGINFLRMWVGGIDTGETEQYYEGEDLVTVPVTKDGIAIEFNGESDEAVLEKIDTLVPLCVREGQKPIVKKIAENVNLQYPNPQREAYKLSQLYGLTHERLDTYIDNNVTDLASAREFVRKMAHVILWLVKQTKLDE